MKKNAVPLTILLLLTACFSESSFDPEETFKYWTGSEPPDEVQLINGQYYQSPHFTLEYELFLEFKSTAKWQTEFIERYGLVPDQQNDDWKRFAELPNWFTPSHSCSIYSRNDQFDRSRYFFDLKDGRCYIYETVGM